MLILSSMYLLFRLDIFHSILVTQPTSGSIRVKYIVKFWQKVTIDHGTDIRRGNIKALDFFFSEKERILRDEFM